MIHAKCDISHARLLELLSYEEETGRFTWRKLRPGIRTDQPGTLVGGYRRISLDGERYAAHRLAWFYVHHEWPMFDLDHINGHRDDNRLANLRKATRAENVQNIRRARKDSRSGLPGAFPTPHGTWASRIQTNRRMLHLGTFKTKEEAHAAYMVAKAKLHAFFVGLDS